MGQMYIQDEVTEQKLEKLQETVDKIYNDLTVIYSNLLRKHRITEERLEAIEKLLVCVANPENFVKPKSLEIGKEYIEEISFVATDMEEKNYKGLNFLEYRLKLKGSDEVYRMFIQRKYKVVVGTKVGFSLEEGNWLRKVKIYE